MPLDVELFSSSPSPPPGAAVFFFTTVFEESKEEHPFASQPLSPNLALTFCSSHPSLSSSALPPPSVSCLKISPPEWVSFPPRPPLYSLYHPGELFPPFFLQYGLRVGYSFRENFLLPPDSSPTARLEAIFSYPLSRNGSDPLLFPYSTRSQLMPSSIGERSTFFQNCCPQSRSASCFSTFGRQPFFFSALPCQPPGPFPKAAPFPPPGHNNPLNPVRPTFPPPPLSTNQLLT